jgi:hypothetical protein
MGAVLGNSPKVVGPLDGHLCGGAYPVRESSESLTSRHFDLLPSVRAGLFLPFIAVLFFLSLFDVPFSQETDSPFRQVALVDEDEVDRSETKVSQLLSDDNQDSLGSAAGLRAVHPQQRLGRSQAPSLPQCCRASSLITRAPPTV